MSYSDIKYFKIPETIKQGVRELGTKIGGVIIDGRTTAEDKMINSMLSLFKELLDDTTYVSMRVARIDRYWEQPSSIKGAMSKSRHLSFTYVKDDGSLSSSSVYLTSKNRAEDYLQKIITKNENTANFYNNPVRQNQLIDRIRREIDKLSFSNQPFPETQFEPKLPQMQPAAIPNIPMPMRHVITLPTVKIEEFLANVWRRNTGNTLVLYGKSSSGKTTLLSFLYLFFFVQLRDLVGNPYYKVLVAPNHTAGVYDLIKKITPLSLFSIVSDLSSHLLSKYSNINKILSNDYTQMYERYMRMNSLPVPSSDWKFMYPVLFIVDDIVNANRSEELTKMFLSLRNMCMNMIFMIQSFKLLGRNARNSCNFIVMGALGPEVREDVIDSGMLNNDFFMRFVGTTNLSKSDKIAIYEELTSGYDKIILDTLHDEYYKMEPLSEDIINLMKNPDYINAVRHMMGLYSPAPI